MHDATLVKFLLRQTLLLRKKEEEERNKEEEEETEQFLVQSMQEHRLLSKTSLAASSLQPTNSSVFPSIDDWPQMLDIIASMYQKDNIPRKECAHRRLRQWHVQGRFYWLRCFRAVFSLIVGRPVLPASWSSWTGLFVARCATTRLMVQTVQIYVLEQFLDKVVARPLRPWSLHRCIS